MDKAQLHKDHRYGLRTVASIEALKGVLVLLLGAGLLLLLHKDLEDVAQRLTEILHVNPEGKLSNLFYAAAEKATDKGLWMLAAGALAYSIVRFVEAYGLWHERDWAEWFALLSGTLYLPWEILTLIRHPHPIKWVVLLINVAVVLYMLKLRLEAIRLRAEEDTLETEDNP